MTFLAGEAKARKSPSPHSTSRIIPSESPRPPASWHQLCEITYWTSKFAAVAFSRVWAHLSAPRDRAGRRLPHVGSDGHPQGTPPKLAALHTPRPHQRAVALRQHGGGWYGTSQAVR